MTMDGDDTTIYKVVVNHEEQYSIWPADRENPRGWTDVGKSGRKDECLAYIREVWTDMRPLSLRKQMEEAERTDEGRAPTPPPVRERRSLVDRLSEAGQPLQAALRPARTAGALKECIDRGFVRVKFTQTEGGTELGFKLDAAESDVGRADFGAGTGDVRLVGRLTLDGVRVKCVADIDVATLSGTGHLEPITD